MEAKYEADNLRGICCACQLKGVVERRIIITVDEYGDEFAVGTYNVTVRCTNIKCHLYSISCKNWVPYSDDRFKRPRLKRQNLDRVHGIRLDSSDENRQLGATIPGSRQPSTQAQNDGKATLDAQSKTIRGMESPRQKGTV